MVEQEFKRKLVHIIVGFFVITYFFLDRLIIIILCILLIIAALFSKRYKRIYSIIMRTGEKRTSALWRVIHYITSMLLLSIFFDYRLAGAGILTLAWGDGLATLIGRKYGRRQITRDSTIIGSFSMFAFSFIGTAISLRFIPFVQGFINAPSYLSIQLIILTSLAASFFTAISEIKSRSSYDNLTAPLVHASILALLINTIKL